MTLLNIVFNLKPQALFCLPHTIYSTAPGAEDICFCGVAGLQNRPAREQRGVSNFTYPKEDTDFFLAFVLFAPAKSRFLEHFNFEIIHTDKMLWPCETSFRKAREFGVGGLCPPLSDKLKAKLL